MHGEFNRTQNPAFAPLNASLLTHAPTSTQADGSSAICSLAVYSDYACVYPAIHFAGGTVNALSMHDQVIAAVVDDVRLFLWNCSKGTRVCRCLLDTDLRRHGYVNCMSIHRLALRRGVGGYRVAVGFSKGFISVLTPLGIEAHLGYASRRVDDEAQVPCGEVLADDSRTAKFACAVQRAILPPFKGALRSVLFFGGRILSEHDISSGDGHDIGIALNESCVRGHSTTSETAQKMRLARGRSILFTEGCVVWLSGDAMVGMMPEAFMGNTDSHIGPSINRLGLMTDGRPFDRTMNHPWIAHILRTSSLESARAIVVLNGMCKPTKALLLLLQAALHCGHITLVDKLVPPVVREPPRVWLECSMAVILEVMSNFAMYKRIGSHVYKSFVDFLIACVRKASVGGHAMESRILSGYLKILRRLQHKEGVGATNGRGGHGLDIVETQERVPSTAYEILKQGIESNRMSEAIYRMLQIAGTEQGGLQSLPVTLNAYVLHLLRKGSSDEIKKTLFFLDKEPRAVLHEIFWKSFDAEIREKAMHTLQSLGIVDGAAARAMQISHALQRMYLGVSGDPDDSPSFGTGAPSFNLLAPESFQTMAFENFDMTSALIPEGVMGGAWPNRGTFMDFEEFNALVEEGNDTILKLPALWMSDWTDRTLKLLSVESRVLGRKELTDAFLDDCWEAALQYACEHTDMSILERVLASIPERCKGPGQMKVMLPNQRGHLEVSMPVFTPDLPHGSSSLVLACVERSLATHGMLSQLYWPSALKLVALFERTHLNANFLHLDGSGECKTDALPGVGERLYAVRCLTGALHDLPNCTSMYSAEGFGVADAWEILRRPKSVSWCDWIAVSQTKALAPLACALNISLACNIPIETDGCDRIAWMGGLDKHYMNALPLLGYEASPEEGTQYFSPDFWRRIKEQLASSDALMHRFPTLASFIRKSVDGPAHLYAPRLALREEETLYTSLRNAMFTCSDQMSLLVSHCPPHLPFWLKKLIHFSTNVRHLKHEGASDAGEGKGKGKRGGGERGEGGEEEMGSLAAYFVAREVELERYIEKEFYVLPCESSDFLCIQNHLQHGRTFAALSAFLKANADTTNTATSSEGVGGDGGGGCLRLLLSKAATTL